MNGRLPPLTRPSAAQDLVHAIPMVGFGACGALTFGTQETIGSPLLNGGIPYIHHMRGVFGHVLSKPFTSKIVIWRWGGGGVDTMRLQYWKMSVYKLRDSDG